MSDLRVTNLRGRTAGAAPTLPDGLVVTGIATATEYDITGSSNTFNASGINVGVITATSSVTIGSTNVLTAINAKASTGKAIAMAMVFG